MKWEELKKLIIAEYDRRNLATNRRNSSINRIELMIAVLMRYIIS